MKVNTINVVACGGCGINIANSVFSDIKALGDGFSNIKLFGIDTSTSNSNGRYESDIDVYKISGTDFDTDKANITGSGGERQTNVPAIVNGVKEFLDVNKMRSPVNGEYYVVISSGGGGSGSVISTLLTKELMKRNMPVIVLIVGDSSNGLSAINTLNTLAGFDNVAKSINKALSMVYVNNQAYNSGNKERAEKDANKAVFNTMASISLFLSGVNSELDSTDMMNFINQSNYKTIKIKPGVYGLMSYSCDIKVPDGSVPTIARSLTIEGISPDVDMTLLNYKSGIVLEDNAKTIYEDQFPIHLVTYGNFLSREVKELQRVVSDYNNIMNSIESIDLVGEGEANDDGLVF